MLRGTGSTIDSTGKRYYGRLAGSPGHVAAAMSLMANWDLHPLLREIPTLKPHLVLVSGSKDGMVPAAEAYRIRSVVPNAELVSLRGLGHLAHEERPNEIAALVERMVPHETTG
jgi:magnesium chelatase accessory protein